MNWEHLLELAEDLATAPSGGRPQQTRLRKANSAAYYAMFHALANSNADLLIGSGPAIRRSEEWTVTHRSLNHGTAKDHILNRNRMATFHHDIQDFSRTFIALQVQRHEADYNPNPLTPLTRTQTVRNIERAWDAIKAFHTVPAQERKRFATYLLFHRRG